MSLADKRYCINCRVMRPREGWRHVLIKGARQRIVLRCGVCIARAKQSKSCS